MNVTKPIRPKFIFTPSAGKTGTTALAHWLVDNKLAQHVVPGKKEPYLLLDPDFSYDAFKSSDMPYLDASVGYAEDPNKVARFPPGSLVLFCLRNPLDRLWSMYKMVKIMITKPEGTTEYFASSGGGVDMEEIEVQDRHNNCMSAQRAREVFLINTELLRKQTFHERLHYEIGFFLSWHHFPARSLVYSSTYNFSKLNSLHAN